MQTLWRNYYFYYSVFIIENLATSNTVHDCPFTQGELDDWLVRSFAFIPCAKAKLTIESVNVIKAPHTRVVINLLCFKKTSWS